MASPCPILLRIFVGDVLGCTSWRWLSISCKLRKGLTAPLGKKVLKGMTRSGIEQPWTVRSTVPLSSDSDPEVGLVCVCTFGIPPQLPAPCRLAH